MRGSVCVWGGGGGGAPPPPISWGAVLPVHSLHSASAWAPSFEHSRSQQQWHFGTWVLKHARSFPALGGLFPHLCCSCAPCSCQRVFLHQPQLSLSGAQQLHPNRHATACRSPQLWCSFSVWGSQLIEVSGQHALQGCASFAFITHTLHTAKPAMRCGSSATSCL